MNFKLSNHTLSRLPKTVNVPSYNRANLTGGIVHIGVGNFHRAHQAVYLDRLFNEGLDHDFAIIGAGLMPYDDAVRRDLEKQDWLTTVIELDPDGLKARVCGAMIDYTQIDTDALIKQLAAPNIKIVSLTITEGGYFLDAATGGLQLDHPEIEYDIGNIAAPKTVFGCLIAALKIRRDANIPPFTVMSCDNIPENGLVTKNAVCGIANAANEELGNWINNNVAFPNSMVDCITPAMSERERQLVKDEFQIDDARPVVCEPFRQWILEDNFPLGRPALEKVGVEFVKDVAPYELMKLRILNGGHAAIAYPAGLLGIHYVHDAMAHPLISAFLSKLAKNEVIPTVQPIEGVDFEDYFDEIVVRFSNPAIADTIQRLCLDGSDRQPKFILPTIQDRLDNSQPIDGLALEVALWCRYCAGKTDDGEEIRVDDGNAEMLREHAKRAQSDPSSFLEMDTIFGPLRDEDMFRSAFCEALVSLQTNGTEATIRSHLEA